MNFSIGDFHFGIYVFEWHFDFRMFVVMVGLVLAIMAFLLWKIWRRP